MKRTPEFNALLTFVGVIAIGMIVFRMPPTKAIDSLLAGMVMFNLIRLYQR